MTHEELEAIRANLERSAPPGAGRSLHHDVADLLAYIDELHNIVHDLRQEPGWELGRQEERREVLELLENELDILEDQDAHAEAEAVEIAARKVLSRGPVAPHLAPDDLRRQNEVLRSALAAVADAYRSEDALTRWSRVTAAIRAAVPLLGEDV